MSRNYFDPATTDDSMWDREVESGKIDAYNRTDSGGVQKYYNQNNGDVVIKDVEPADNEKGHQQTDFYVSNGYITSMESHDD